MHLVFAVLGALICAESDAGPIAGAEIVVEATDVSKGGAERAGDDGCVTISSLNPGGSYTLKIRAPGMLPLDTVLTIPENTGAEPDKRIYRLTTIKKSKETIIVEGVRDPEGATQHQLKADEINVLPGTQGDALKAIQNLPGLARPPAILGALLVRGAAPEDTAVFVDGHEVPQLYHFGGLTSVVSTDVLSSIDFLPGGFGVRYGGATGGVVEVRTRNAEYDGWHGSLDADLYDAAIVGEGPAGEQGKYGVVVATARRSYVDAVLNAAIPDGALNFTVAPRYYDYQLRYSAPPQANGDTSYVLAYGSDDALTFVTNEPAGPQGALRGRFFFHNLFHRVQGGWNRPLSGDWMLAVEPGVGFERIVIDAGDIFAVDVRRYDVSLRAEARGTVRSNLRLMFGTEQKVVPVDVSLEIVGTSDQEEPVVSEINELRGTTSYYAQAAWRITPELTLIPGVRFDGYFPQSKWSLDPRVSARYGSADESWFMKAYAGLYHQPPEPEEWNPDIGNENLELQVAYHFGVGAGGRLGEQTTVESELFYKWLDDFVVNVPSDPSNPVVNVPRFSNEGIGRVYGGELLVRRELSKNLYGWIAYTLSRSERADPYSDGGWRPFTFDQTHILTVLLGYKLPHGWEVGGRFRFATGNPTTEIIGSIYDSDFDDYIPVPGPPNGARIPAFHQLDVRVDKRWEFKRWKLGIYLDVQNVYNRANPEGIDYDFNYENRALVTGLPVFPSIGIRGSF